MIIPVVDLILSLIKTALNSAMHSMHHDLKNHGIATCTPSSWLGSNWHGWPGGLIDVEESVSGMIKVIDHLSIENSGEYIDYAGKIIPW